MIFPKLNTMPNPMNRILRTIIPLLVLGTGALPLHAALAPASDFDVFPSDVNLKFSGDKQSLVVRFTEANGINRDVTTEAKITLADPAKAKIVKGVVYPLADGETKAKIEWNGHVAEVPVKVEQATAEQPVSFRLDVMPVFMRYDCNRC